MPDHSPEEVEVQELASAAAASTSTNPWGPVRNKLAEHAGVSAQDARAIGIQDSTVIDRAIGSPGMLKPLTVHGFVVKNPPLRQAADVSVVVEKVKQQIRIAPYISTAVVLPYTNSFYPSHVLSSAPDVGGVLAGRYPHANHDLSIEKETTDSTATVPKGPWRVLPAELIALDAGSVVASLDDPEDEARYLAPGDAVVLIDPGGSHQPIGVGRLHHIRPDAAGRLLLVFDRYSAVEISAVIAATAKDLNEEG
jgi:hypothetical protein